MIIWPVVEFGRKELRKVVDRVTGSNNGKKGDFKDGFAGALDEYDQPQRVCLGMAIEGSA